MRTSTRYPLRECRIRLKVKPVDGMKCVRRAHHSVFSCSNYPFGFFNAYGNAARRDEIDYAVHVGDYMWVSTEVRANNH